MRDKHKYEVIDDSEPERERIRHEVCQNATVISISSGLVWMFARCIHSNPFVDDDSHPIFTVANAIPDSPSVSIIEISSSTSMIMLRFVFLFKI
jgi:hypothetical protein